MKNTNRILGIDYGSKRIGVALSTEEGKEIKQLALPHSVVQNSKHAIDDILKICAENTVSKIVVGESKDFSQQDNLIMDDIKNFIEAMKEKSDIEIVLHPEFMTSAQAQHDQGKNDMLDASAATIILQSYIDSHTN